MSDFRGLIVAVSGPSGVGSVIEPPVHSAFNVLFEVYFVFVKFDVILPAPLINFVAPS